jgi:hypothetical protein
MNCETYTLEALVLPRGIKALFEDQAIRSAVLASMPTLDEGGLAVRQVGGDPNRGIQIPGASPDRQQRADQGPGGPSHGGPGPAGKGKEKVPVPEHHHKHNTGATLNQRDDEAQGAATTRSSQEEGSRSQRLQRGDGSFMGESAPKRQKTAEPGGQSQDPPPPSQRQKPQGRSEEARWPSSQRQTPLPQPTSQCPATPPRPPQPGP